jgi:ribosomal protein L31E
MKGNEAEYIISLRKAFDKPPIKRPKAALNEIKKFIKKHTRIENVLISNEVNEFIFKNSKNIPRKLNIVLLKQKNKIKVYLKGSKKLEEDKKAAEKAKETKKLKKTETKKETKENTKEKETKEKHEKELKEKKQKEKAAEAVSIKRK